jgi:hypothetical protein
MFREVCQWTVPSGGRAAARVASQIDETKNPVAQRLSLAPRRVRTYLQRARTRYATAGRPAPSKAALVARAIQDGIVSVNDL